MTRTKKIELLPTLFDSMDVPDGSYEFYYREQPFVLYVDFLHHKKNSNLSRRSSFALFETEEKIQPERVSLEDNVVVFDFKVRNKLQRIAFALNQEEGDASGESLAVFERVSANPIMQPCADRPWESLAVFNTAAIMLEDKVHVIYRAIGPSGLSTFGYASSEDGINVNERLADPVYVATNALPTDQERMTSSCYSYQSGISAAGCEDPRLSQVGDTIFMTYTTYDGVHPPGVALTSISVSDFLSRRWNWSEASLISAPHQCHKNWVVFPEKLNGRYAILHSLSPEVLIDYRDTLSFERGDHVDSHYSSRDVVDRWDNWMRGVALPPIRTADGWLTFYHAMDTKDPNRYKLGALLLDLDDPSKILCRIPYPLLEPDAPYENEGFKAGVIYACGAVIKQDDLIVYYGAADTTVCAATIELSQLLAQLKSTTTSQRAPTHARGAHV